MIRTIKWSAFCIASLLIVLCANVYVASSRTAYGDSLGKSVITAVIAKDEQRDWKPVAYPTDDFGIATLYDGKGVGSLLCATTTCLGLSDNKTETLKTAGYIEAGKGGADHTRRHTEKDFGCEHCSDALFFDRPHREVR